MRPVRVTLNAAGYSQWVLIDYIESWFGSSLGVIPSEDGNLTYTVQYTLDSDAITSQSQTVQVSRSGNTATVFDPGPNGIGHGLSTGDSVIIKGTGSPYLDSPVAPGSLSVGNNLSASGVFGPGDVGWTVASTPSATTYTYTVQNAGPTADLGVTRVSRLRVFPHGTLANLTARGNGTLNYPVRAIRLYVSAYTAGFVDMLVLQGITA